MQSAPMAVAQGSNQPTAEWGSSVFDIMADDKICLQTCCCGFCTASNMVNMLDKNIPKLDPIVCCGLCCADYFLRGGATASLAFGLRRQLLTKYQITGEDYCKSCLLTACCGPCSICQLQREMTAKGQNCGGLCVGDPPAQQVMGASTPLVGAAMGALGAKIGGMMPGQSSNSALPPRYNSELFGCELMECLDGWCCFCCVMGMMSNKLDAGRIPELPVGGENKIHLPACLGAWCFGPGMAMGMRRELAMRYNLEGESLIMSLVLSLFCAGCSLCQMRREMGYRGEWVGGMLYKEAPAMPAAK